jgi:hypothetical protein
MPVINTEVITSQRECCHQLSINWFKGGLQSFRQESHFYSLKQHRTKELLYSYFSSQLQRKLGVSPQR